MNSHATRGKRGCYGAWAILWGGVLGALLSLNVTAQGREPWRVERINVPASKPQTWPAGPWMPLPRDEFERLWSLTETQDHQPPEAWLQDSTWTATLRGMQFENGQWTAEVRGIGERAQWLRLDPLNLELRELQLDGGSAVWGATGDGQAWLQVPKSKQSLQARWSATGARLGPQTTFDLQVPRAGRTTLLLKLPSRLELTSSAGEVTALPPDADGWVPWRVQLGRLTRCELTLAPQRAGDNAAPTLLYETESIVTIDETETRAQWGITWESPQGATKELGLLIPRGYQIVGATLGEAPIDWTIENAEPKSRVRFTLPQTIRGRGRRLRLEMSSGVTRSPAAGAIAVSTPFLELEHGVFLGAQQEVRVRPPLQIRNYRLQQATQVSPMTRTVDGEILRVAPSSPGGRLSLEVQRPASTVAAQVLSIERRATGGQTVAVEMLWTVSSGELYAARCGIAPGWKLVDVQPSTRWRRDLPNTRREPVNFEIESAAAGETRLVIEFSEPASPANSAAALLEFQPLELPGQPAPALPPILPLDGESFDAVLGALHHELRDAPDSQWQAIAFDKLPEWARQSELIPDPLVGPTMNWLQGLQLRTDDTRRIPWIENDASKPERPSAAALAAPAAPPVFTTRDPLLFVDLETHVNRPSNARDRHRAAIQALEPCTSLAVAIPAGLQIDEVLIAGQGVPFSIDDQRWLTIRHPQGTAWQQAELRFGELEPASTWLSERTLELPLPEGQVLSWAWTLHVPAGVRPRLLSPGWRWLDRLPDAPWTERLFGPLGRDTWGGMFNPFFWLTSFSAPPEPLSPVSGELPFGSTWRAVALTPPARTHVVLWEEEPWLAGWFSALIGTLLCGVALRIWRPGFRGPLAAGWFGLHAAGTLLAPEPYVQLHGAFLSGALLAILLPRRFCQNIWLKPGFDFLGGSTQSFQLPPTGSTNTFAGLLLLCGLAMGTAIAVDSAPNGDVILTPVDDAGLPSQTLPLVYVSRSLHQKLEALGEAARRATPELLWQAGELTAKPAPGDAIQVVGQWTIHRLPSASAEIEAPLPLGAATLIGDTPCQLDGYPAPVIRKPDGKFVIRLPAVTQPESGRLTVSYLTPLTVGGRQATWPIVVPACGSTRLSLLPPPAWPLMEASSLSAPESMGMVGSFAWGLAGIAPLKLAADPDSLKTLSQNELSHMQVVELHPQRTSIWWRAVVTSLTDSWREISFRVPSGALVRRLNAVGLKRYETQEVAGEGTVLKLQWSEPPRTEVLIEGELVLPAGAMTPLRVDPIEPRTTPDVEWNVTRAWRGVSAPSDFELKVLEPPLETVLLPATPEEFLQEWRDGPAVLMPQIVHDVRDPLTLAASLTPLTPRRRAGQVRQSALVQPQRLEWVYQADVEVSRSAVFQHTLLIDRRLRLQSVSVQEQGAERLLRYSAERSNDQTRLTLFLSDRTRPSGLQTVTVRGTMPWRPYRRERLPFVALENTDIGSQQLSLVDGPGARSEVISQSGLELLPAPENTSSAARQFRMVDRLWKAEVQTQTVDPNAIVRYVWICEPKPAEMSFDWHLRGQIQWSPGAEAMGQRVVQLPGAPSDLHWESDDGAAWQSRFDADAKTTILQALSRPGRGTVLRTEQTDRRDDLPNDYAMRLPVFPEGTAAEGLVVLIDPQQRYRFAAGAQALSSLEVPDWATGEIAPLVQRDIQVIRLPAGQRSWRILARPESVSATQVTLVDTHLQVRDGHELSGVSHVFLSTPANVLEFMAPEGVGCEAAMVDGVWRPLTNSGDQRWLVPLGAGDHQHVVSLLWKHARFPKTWWGRHEVALPQVLGVTPARTFVSIHRTDLRSALPPRPGLPPSDAIAARAGAWGDLARDSDPGVARQGFATRLAKGTAAALFGADAPRLANGLPLVPEGLPRTLFPNERTTAHSPIRASDALYIDPAPFSPSTSIVALAPGATICEMWAPPSRGFWRFAGACLVVLVAPLAQMLLRWNPGDWFSRHPTLAWSIFGLVWWLCFRPSVAGFVILAIALLRRAIRRFRSLWLTV